MGQYHPNYPTQFPQPLFGLPPGSSYTMNQNQMNNMGQHQNLKLL